MRQRGVSQTRRSGRHRSPAAAGRHGTAVTDDSAAALPSPGGRDSVPPSGEWVTFIKPDLEHIQREIHEGRGEGRSLEEAFPGYQARSYQAVKNAKNPWQVSPLAAPLGVAGTAAISAAAAPMKRPSAPRPAVSATARAPQSCSEMAIFLDEVGAHFFST